MCKPIYLTLQVKIIYRSRWSQYILALKVDENRLSTSAISARHSSSKRQDWTSDPLACHNFQLPRNGIFHEYKISIERTNRLGFFYWPSRVIMSQTRSRLQGGNFLRDPGGANKCCIAGRRVYTRKSGNGSASRASCKAYRKTAASTTTRMPYLIWPLLNYPDRERVPVPSSRWPELSRNTG